MARRALRPCSYPGCPNLVDSGRCAEHAGVSGQSGSGWKRDKARQRLYGRKWQKFRAAYLAEHPWCVSCERIGISTPSEHVDHVVDHKGDVVLFWRGPFQALCHSCHSKKTASENRGGR